MRKRKLLIFFPACLLLGALGWALLSSREPSYEGIRLHDWLKEADFCGPNQSNLKRAIEGMGQPAVTYLLHELQAADSATKARYLKLASNHDWLPDLEPADIRRYHALIGFGILGTNAPSAIQPLNDLLVNHSNPEIRSAAAQALYAAGPSSQSALTALLDALKDPDPRVRGAAALSIGHIHDDQNVAIPGLINCLADRDSSVVGCAVRALGELGSGAAAALLPIEKAWGMLDRHGRMAAINAALNINLEQSQNIFLLGGSDPDDWVLRACFRTLARATNQPQIAVPLLLRCASQTNLSLSVVPLAQALAAFGTNAQSGAPVLLSLLTRTNGTVQIAIAKALYTIDPVAAKDAGWTPEKFGLNRPVQRRGLKAR